ncbi:hypothetical protein TNCV_2949211 [Trichonephila clavipes]|nr:hypothetical protein TNCV_2949211 [Trichonephila clavipes]
MLRPASKTNAYAAQQKKRLSTPASEVQSSPVIKMRKQGELCTSSQSCEGQGDEGQGDEGQGDEGQGDEVPHFKFPILSS